jgi:hypothetical protein
MIIIFKVPQFSTKYIYNIVENNWVGGYTHPMIMFIKLLNIVDENDFLNKIFKIILAHYHIFFHYHNFISNHY